MKLELDCKSIGNVQSGDIVAVREIKAYAPSRDDQDGKYATVHRTARRDFDTGNGAIDYYRRDAVVRSVIGNCVTVSPLVQSE